MRNEKWIITLVVGMMAGPVLAQNLSDTIIHTLETGPDMQMLVEQRYAQEENIKQAYSHYFPKIDTKTLIGLEQSRNPDTKTKYGSRNLRRREAGIIATQMVYDGYSARSNLESQLWQTKSSAFGLQNSAQEIAMDVIQTYLDLMRLHDLLELSEENLSVHEGTNDKLHRQNLNGLAYSADLQQAIARQAEAQNDYLNARQALEAAETYYKRLVGISADVESMTLPEMPDKILPITIGAAVATAFNSHPALRAEVSRVAAKKADYREAGAAFRPRIELELQANERENIDGRSGSDDDMSALLKIQYNLFNGGADISKKRQDARAVAAATEQRNLLRRQVEESVRTRWSALLTLEEQAQYIQKKLSAIRVTRDAYRHEYTMGQRSMLDVLDTEDEHYQANQAAINSQYDQLIEKFSLLSSIGKLLETLNIPMPQAGVFEEEDFSPFNLQYLRAEMGLEGFPSFFKKDR